MNSVIELQKLFIKFAFEHEKNESTDTVSVYIAKRYEETLETQRRLNNCRKLLRKIETDYKLKQEEINKEIYCIQNDCNHPLTTYYPDASGGSDSHTLCNICDADVRKSSK